MSLQDRIFNQILKNHPKINQSYARNLASVIITKSTKYQVPADVYTAILMQESAYDLKAKNIHCGFKTEDSTEKTCVITDFGISQIHYKNIGRFNLDKKRLISDLDYSVDAGARILATYTRYQKDEPGTWYSRYNCGVKSKSYLRDACLFYKSKVDRYF